MDDIVHITISLKREEIRALCILAEQRRRDPKDQAALMIRRSLEEYGLSPWSPGSHLPIDEPPPPPPMPRIPLPEKG